MFENLKEKLIDLLWRHQDNIDSLIDYLDPMPDSYLSSKISTKLLCNYISPVGKRITTYELVMPRFMLVDFNTHRALSRNTASSRAIPSKKIIDKANADPFFPVFWGKNQKGMQAYQELPAELHPRLNRIWNRGRRYMAQMVADLQALEVHKQIANRPLEWCIYQTTICTMTEDENFYNLRKYTNTQPEFRHLANIMYECKEDQEPEEVEVGFWSRPLLFDLEELIAEGYNGTELNKISVGRCARVSYLTHDGIRDPKADIELHDRMLREGHYSPHEHVAMALNDPCAHSGNFVGWLQYRKTIRGEEVFRPESLL